MTTIFTPIEFVQDLSPKKDQTLSKHLENLLAVSQKLRAFPTILDAQDADYLEIISLLHKHTVPAAIKIICDFNSLNDELSSESTRLSTDGKNFMLVKLRLLHFLHNLCRRLHSEGEFFNIKFEEFGVFYSELLSRTTINVYLGLGFARFNEQIFCKLASAFTAVLWIQLQMNPWFRKRITIPISPSLSADFEYAIEFWKDIFDHYEEFDVDNIEFLGNILEYAFENDVNYLEIYGKLSHRKQKSVVLFFIQDYIEKHIVDNDSGRHLQLSKTVIFPFLVRTFSVEVDGFKLCETTNLLQKQESNLQLSLVATIVKCLSTLITKENIRNFMKEESELLRTVIDLGLYIKMLETIDPENFKPINKISERKVVAEQRNALENDPTIGLKTAIVKLIANLVDKHPANQDLVRENEGLAFILDCSQIDDRNSFIQQWAIFAVNNVLKNNSANQEFVGSMTKRMNDNSMTP